ncbi:MAG: phospho-N-acetylmuramoyl-pentapeptide-transferase [Candidatus Omnitrophota bacterium]
MLYYIFYPLHKFLFAFNVFKYITFRSGLAALTSFILTLVFIPIFIKKVKEIGAGQNIRREYCDDLYKLHSIKQGTPTMGGIVIVSSILISTLLWANFLNRYILITLFGLIWLAVIGFMDDYIKFSKKRSMGLTLKEKFAAQLFLGLIVGIFIYLDPYINTKLDVPFIKNEMFSLGIFYLLFVIIVIVGASNAVNLTDGLDGLAIGSVIMVACVYAILSYITGNIKFSQYLLVPYIQGSGELAVFCAAMIGAGLGFLWYNSYPASIFMGDVGSLSLGGAIGIVAILIKKELLLVIVGGIFFIEALSVLLQIFSVRLRGRRIFKIAPLHHHFQLTGMHESKVIIRFWIIGIILMLLTLMTLKLR